jgi:1-acyl-sn-glycerol-3-phosphate acyltransferase
MKWYFLSPLALQKLIWIPTRLILSFFGHLEIKGLENLETVKGNAIFACNHVSELDPFLVPASLPFWSHFSPIFYTSRESKFYVNSGWRQHFYGGWFFKIWGSYPVSVGLHDYEKSLHHHIRIVRSGGSLCIYPEGRTTPDGSIQPAKGGVAYLAHITGRPVIPVLLNGHYKLSLRNLLLRRRQITVTYGAPMYVSVRAGVTPSIDDLKMYANEIMKRIQDMRTTAVPAVIPNVQQEKAPVVVRG